MSYRIVLVAVLVVSSAQAGTVIYVDISNWPGPGDGSELNPYYSIQAAIADAAMQGDQIVVAPGTYFESINFVGKTIYLRSSYGPEVTRIFGYESFHVVQCVNGEGPGTRLEGFTISGGSATGEDSPDNHGGGMYNNSSSPTVIHCTFTGNVAWVGGGMYNTASDVIVSHCTFVGNDGWEDGGGIASVGSNVSVQDCAFVGNRVTQGWGGGLLHSGGVLTVHECVFNGNNADYGGGISNGAVNATVTSCVFIGNRAFETGGGLYDTTSNLAVRNCTFIENESNLGAGGMRCAFGSIPTVVNCTFVENGGVHASAGAIRGDAIVLNCILFDNFPIEILGDATVAYSNVQGGWPGVGNIDVNPQFIDPDSGGLRLMPGSPCIDAGHNNAIAGRADTDLDGNPRFTDDPATSNTGCGVPVVVDMGAYEFQGNPATVLLGDVNGDGRVGVLDLLTLGQCLGSTDPGCCVADLDLDGEVGMSDLALLMLKLTQSLPAGLGGR